MKTYTMLYKRDSGSKFETTRSVDTSVYTASIAAPNKTNAQKQLIKREATTGLGRKIRIIRVITEK